MTEIKREFDGYQVHFWTDGGMQNGYFIRDSATGDETPLYCDSEGADFIEHLLQLGDGDFWSDCDDELKPFRKESGDAP